MIYLIDPKSIYGAGRCPGVVYPLYGVPPEAYRQVCSTY